MEAHPMSDREDSTAPPTRPPLDEGNGLRETYAYFLPLRLPMLSAS